MNPRTRLHALPAFGSVVLAGVAVWGLMPSSGQKDLTYAVQDGIPLTLDLDFPAPLRPCHPVVLFIPPDGEWPRALKRDPRIRKLLNQLTERGYAVATPHYRPPGRYRFPAQIEDGKAAIRWLRANADRYRLDALHVGVVGVSQGGWGACMLGVTSPQDGLEGGGGNGDQSSRVQAVVGLGVPGDFAARHLTERVENVYLRPLLGTGYEGNPALYERASPGAYASADDPPFLLFHSRDDLVVPVGMARALVDRLQRAGVSVTLVEEDGMDHVWAGSKLEQAIEQTVQFLDRHLKRGS